MGTIPQERAGSCRWLRPPLHHTGGAHCGGGVALDKFDALTALTDWVEHGKAPRWIIASIDPANKEIPATWSANRSRPLCPYPSYAAYSEYGDIEDAATYVCKAP